MNAPTMAGWNLALRFGLELAALSGLGIAAWKVASGPWRWGAVVAIPLLAAIAWGVFNVPGDPSRSGAAPIQVPGGVRLAIELAILGAGSAALLLQGPRIAGATVAVLLVVHYLSSTPRISWLLDQ